MPPAQEKLRLTHELFILDAHLKEKLDSAKSESITRRFVQDLLVGLNMSELGDLCIYPATDMRAPGWSFVQPITTSHCSGHYFDGEKPHLHLDVYSCTPVNHRLVLELADKHFDLLDWAGNFTTRSIDPLKRRTVEFIGIGNKILNKYSLHAQNLHVPDVHSTVY